MDALLETQQYETCLALCLRGQDTDPAVAAKAPAIFREYGLALLAKMEWDKVHMYV